MRTVHRGAVALVTLTALTMAACGRGEDRPGSGAASASASGDGGTATTLFKAAEADARVDVTARDYAFDGVPATITGRKVLFTVKNTGTDLHELEVFGADGEPVSDVHVDGGDTKTLGLKLAPGAYTAQCLLKEGSRTHADLGMKTTFTVA